jgi:uncharacterized protein YaiI (UPF0178 family)
VVGGGNAPMSQQDKSRFLQTLDQAVQALKAGRRPKFR